MDNRLVIARKELRSLFDEKTIVLAIAIQLFIAAFSSFLVVGLVTLYDPSSLSGGGTTVAVTGEYVDEIVGAVEEEGLNAETYPDLDSATQAFSVGEAEAVLQGQTSGGRISIFAIAPDSSLQTTRVVVQLRGVLRQLELSQRQVRSDSLETRPLRPPAETRSSPYFGFTYTVLIPLLMFLPVFISGSITSDSITEEMERGTLELLEVTPTDDWDILGGKMLAYAAIAPVQAAAWIALLSINDTPVHGAPAILLLVSSVTLLIVAFGATVGLLFGDRRRAQLIYSLGVVLLFGASTLVLNPMNQVAKLSIGSPSSEVYLAVAGYAGLAAAVYLLLRYAAREDPFSRFAGD